MPLRYVVDCEWNLSLLHLSWTCFFLSFAEAKINLARTEASMRRSAVRTPGGMWDEPDATQIFLTSSRVAAVVWRPP